MLIEGAPHGTLAVCQGNGWMTKELFVKYLENVCKIVKTSVDSSFLLAVNNHASRILCADRMIQ